jgi:outer membrane protein
MGKVWTTFAIGALALVLGAAQTAMAGDSNGNFQAKLGVTGVITDDTTYALSAISPAGAATDILPGRSASISDTVIPSLTLTYYLNKNLAVELFCCFDKVDLHGAGLLAPAGTIADTWIFPPILTLQYHFDGLGPVRPYVGAGVEWIHYFNSSTSKNGLGASSVSLDDSFGFALQAGVDYDLGNGWSLGADVKKVWEDTQVTWKFADGSRIVAKHDVDPLFLTVNLGYRFNLSDIFGSRSPEPLK